MIIYFSIYCVLGYLMESSYVSLLSRRVISSGLFKGPFIPLYGFGACLLIVLSPYLKNSFLLSFFIGGIAMTLLEYLASHYIEKSFQTKCWDYSKHHFHYQGRICLFYFLMWCFLSLCFIQYIHPFFVSLHLINDTNCLIALIYLSFLLKAYIDRLQIKKIDGLDIH